MTEVGFPADMRVLAVGENSNNLQNLKEILSDLRIFAVTADGLEPAFEAFNQANRAYQPFTLVVFDADLSGGRSRALIDGILGAAGSAAPGFIAVTSSPEMSGAEDLRALGVRGFLRSPVTATDLMAALGAAAGLQSLERLSLFSGQSRSPLLQIEPIPEDRAQRILLASGSASRRRLPTQWLERRGHSVALAASGWEAVEILARERFDIALLDGECPDMDLVETVAAIRAQDRAGAFNTPVVALYAGAADRQRYLLAGVNACLHPAAKPGELFDLVENPPIILVTSTEIIFDFTLFDGDSEFMAEVVNLFLETCPQLLSAIDDACSRGDSGELAQSAHTLKGAVANFGARAVVEQAKALEMMGKHGNMASATVVLGELHALVDRLIPQLQATLVKGMNQQVLP